MGSGAGDVGASQLHTLLMRLRAISYTTGNNYWSRMGGKSEGGDKGRFAAIGK